MPAASAEVERLWVEFADRLGGFLRARVGSQVEADDLRQEVFLKLQKQLHADPSIRDLGAWLYRAARNAVIDHYRKRRPNEPLDESMPDGSIAPDPGADRLLASFRRMIRALPEHYREPILLADIEELPHQEVARRLGLSLPAAKSRILRGRQMLRDSLEACCRFERDRRGAVIGCEPRTARECPECG